jgi:DNA-binding IclR family transcriptional regulator
VKVGPLESKSVRSASSSTETAELRYSAPALEKGLDILELLATQPVGLTQSDIAAKLGRSVNELFRMISCLRRRNYLSSRGDHFVLTLKMFELSHRHPPMHRLLSEAMPVMEELARLLDQSCHLSMYHQGLQLVVAQVDSPGGMGFSVRMGTHVDLFMSASGRILLACQEPSVTDQRVAEHGSKRSVTEIKKLKKLLDVVRSEGYAEMESFQVRGVRAISFPVRGFHGHAVASLTVPYLERLDDPTRKTIDDARCTLKVAADTLTTAIGGRLEFVPD